MSVGEGVVVAVVVVREPGGTGAVYLPSPFEDGERLEHRLVVPREDIGEFGERNGVVAVVTLDYVSNGVERAGREVGLLGVIRYSGRVGVGVVIGHAQAVVHDVYLALFLEAVENVGDGLFVLVVGGGDDGGDEVFVRFGTVPYLVFEGVSDIALGGS